MIVNGFVEHGFEPVRSAFHRNLDERGEVGAACCVVLQGRTVVDIWGGTTEQGGSRTYDQDSLQLIFSATKGLTAACVHLLVERGDIDIDVPVAEYWPEFAAKGKSLVPVRWLLSHRAGLVAVDNPLSVSEVLAWDPVVSALADQCPQWEPGADHGYHAVTFGWLAGELVRRVSGRSIGQFFNDEFAQPLGLDAWIGLPVSEEKRVVSLIGPDEITDHGAKALFDAFLAPNTLSGRAMLGPGGVFADIEVFNRREVRAAELPANNGVTDARSLARLYAALIGEVDGVRLLSPDTIERATRVESDGIDRVLLLRSCYGLGFQLPSPTFAAAGPGTFGHQGAGGSLGFAHREQQIGFGYVMNKMQNHLGGDPRPSSLVEALHSCLGTSTP